MKKLVIFDLDGTLLNTIADLGAAANHALRQNGYPTHPIEAYPGFVGSGISKLIERTLPVGHRSQEQVERLRKDFIDYYTSHMADATEPYPGITGLLSQLTEKGIAVAIASNKYQDAVKNLAARYFPDIQWAAVEGQKDGIPVKPDPSIVFEILGKYPVPKADVLYVGDSGIDMETARRACIESIGVEWGFRPVSELRSSYADHIAATPADILAIATRSE